MAGSPPTFPFFPLSCRIISEETRYQLLRHLEANPAATQRELAGVLGVSLGKLNYCLKALVNKGWVKTGNFSRSPAA